MLKRYDRITALTLPGAKSISMAASEGAVYCVVCRTGEPQAFKWQRSAAMTMQDAVDAQKALTKAESLSYIIRHAVSVKRGLPTEWEL